MVASVLGQKLLKAIFPSMDTVGLLLDCHGLEEWH